MTEEQKRLLEKYSELFTTDELITEAPENKLVEDVSLPTAAQDILSNTLIRVQRDEATLTYAELLDEYYFFKKKGIMKPETFDRLWNL